MSVYARIEGKLLAEFDPVFMEIENESHMHASGKGAESHFKVVLVSNRFEAMRLINRHRAVNSCLAEEFLNDIHALALHTYTEAEWAELQGRPRQSPHCLGGERSHA
ncbi:MAG: BolA/IbaG family iron-sulfur metabolism protein [Idiomarina sp.]|nr:BolA/IbaG family iron-sulfur metabolism protein [Idiomarina sp.]